MKFPKTLLSITLKTPLMNLKFITESIPDPTNAICPCCGEDEYIGIHSYEEGRYRCHTCQKTFAATTGTVFYRCRYPIWVIVLILTLLSYGCPMVAIVKSFHIDKRTVAKWQKEAGDHAKQVQEHVVVKQKRRLYQIQLDEMWIKIQGANVWVATGIDVFTRLFLWGEVSHKRDKKMIVTLIQQIKKIVIDYRDEILFAVDGLRTYPTSLKKVLYTKVKTGLRGRPRHIVWPNLHIVQVIKSRKGKRLTDIRREVAHGSRATAQKLIDISQGGFGLFNTAYIERLNGTFRARMPVFGRRTRSLARTIERVEAELFLSGAVYNFCTVHSTLSASPAMAADLTDHVWSVEELLRFKIPDKRLHG